MGAIPDGWVPEQTWSARAIAPRRRGDRVASSIGTLPQLVFGAVLIRIAIRGDGSRAVSHLALPKSLPNLSNLIESKPLGNGKAANGLCPTVGDCISATYNKARIPESCCC